ncbi:MAG: GIY-YIG nuclease family protein, partial [Bacteroidales bacterium]
MMKHYVYIIQSLIDQKYYKGYTTDYKRRLIEHNQGKSSYTSRKIPWKIIYVEEYDNKS